MIETKNEDVSSQLDRHDQQLCGVLPVMRDTETERLLRALLVNLLSQFICRPADKNIRLLTNIRKCLPHYTKPHSIRSPLF